VQVLVSQLREQLVDADAEILTRGRGTPGRTTITPAPDARRTDTGEA
jgi:hypothetical protein